jgi:predicted RNA-binding Zn ribbon-like protein
VTERQAVKDWEFDSGQLPLDFVNTAEWHLRPEPDESLNDYSDLVSWSAAAGVIDVEMAHYLLKEAAKFPQEAESVFVRALALREAIFGIFLAAVEATEARDSDLALINEILKEASRDLLVEQTPDRFKWEWSCKSLSCMLGPIARSAAELLTSNELDRVGLCADEDHGCGYMFFDTSRNHSRRWCSMDSCGNRAKAKRHYRRSVGADGSS